MASSRTIPQPSSVTWISFLPPASTVTRMRRAPASNAFSNNSLTTEAGRSTTSPAAILLATFSERTWMRPMTSRVIHHRGTEKVSQFQVSSFEFQRKLASSAIAGTYWVHYSINSPQRHRDTEKQRKFLSVKFQGSTKIAKLKKGAKRRTSEVSAVKIRNLSN